MTGRPRPAIAELPTYKPGRNAEAAAIDHGVLDAIKLASNELPYGPLRSVADAIHAAIGSVHLYADHRATELRARLATHLGVEPQRVTVGNGSVGLLQQLVLTFVDRGEQIAMCWPSFEAYPVYSALVEAEQVCVPLRDEMFDLRTLAGCVGPTTKIAFIANPNNPTGTAVGTDEVAAFLAAVPDTCLVVLDEAYHEFVTDPAVAGSLELLDRHPNLVITRTFSKAYGLAGLRVGYAVGHPAVIELVDRTLVPFAVNGVGQRAAIASLDADDEMRARVAAVVAERDRVADVLRGRGWTAPDAQANFVWLPLGERAQEVGVDLERRGIVPRLFAGVGVRVTIGDRRANDRFLAAIHDLTPA